QEGKLEQSPDVLLLDINMPGMGGIKGIPKLKEIYPDAEILMITVFADSDHVFQALCAGASGYLIKNTPLDELKKNIVQITQGGSVMSPAIARKVIEYFNPNRQEYKEELTDREKDVIKGIIDGLKYSITFRAIAGLIT